jgi:hypothetical protein
VGKLLQIGVERELLRRKLTVVAAAGAEKIVEIALIRRIKFGHDELPPLLLLT